MSRRLEIAGWSVTCFVMAILITSARPVYAGKPGSGSSSLPGVRYRLRFIEDDSIQATSVSRITNSGLVVGNSSGGVHYVYQYDFVTGLDTLDTLEHLAAADLTIIDGSNTTRRLIQEVVDVNNSGEVVGTAQVVTRDTGGVILTNFLEGFLLEPTGTGAYTYRSIGTFTPRAINDAGVVAGAWLYTQALYCCPPYNTLVPIGNFNGGNPFPNAISEANVEGEFHIVGNGSNLGGWIWHPNGTWTNPDLWPTKSSGHATQVNGVNINASGRLIATGSVNISRGGGHAFRYTEEGATEDLGSLAGRTSNSWDFDSSYGQGINSEGWVVGDSHIANGALSRAFLYVRADLGGMVNLDKLITSADVPTDLELWMDTSTSTLAVGINNNRLISGRGAFAGVDRAFVLIPIPVAQ
jgi:probable HAF family extracellular repeat protein